jgi:hypothetical protein
MMFVKFSKFWTHEKETGGVFRSDALSQTTVKVQIRKTATNVCAKPISRCVP